MMIIGLIKTTLFIFPFFKELFLGKDIPHGAPGAEISKFRAFVKKAVVGIGCLSVALNVYFTNRLFTLAKQHVALNREIIQLRTPKVQAILKAKYEEETKQSALVTLPVTEVVFNDPVAPVVPAKTLTVAPPRPPPRRRVTSPSIHHTELERLKKLNSID